MCVHDNRRLWWKYAGAAVREAAGEVARRNVSRDALTARHRLRVRHAALYNTIHARDRRSYVGDRPWGDVGADVVGRLMAMESRMTLEEVCTFRLMSALKHSVFLQGSVHRRNAGIQVCNCGWGVGCACGHIYVSPRIQYAHWLSMVGRAGDGRVLRMVLECMSGQPPPLAHAHFALKLHIQCPRLGVRVAVRDDASSPTVSLQLLQSEARVCGTGDVGLTVGSVRLGMDGNGGGDGLLQVSRRFFRECFLCACGVYTCCSYAHRYLMQQQWIVYMLQMCMRLHQHIGHPSVHIKQQAPKIMLWRCLCYNTRMWLGVGGDCECTLYNSPHSTPGLFYVSMVPHGQCA